MTKFSDSNWSILNEYFGVTSSTRTGTHDSYIIGPKHTIVAEGDTYTFLYEDNEDYGFVEHKFKAISIEGNVFKFTYHGVSSTNSLATNLTTITYGADMYFRKGSYFYTWLINNYSEYRDYLNTNKRFIYFGKVWSVAGEVNTYYIEFYGLKDFMYNALPPVNQSTAMEDWIKGYFDKTHHPIYNLTKNIWSMRDPKEIDIRFLQYIANDYGITIDEDATSEINIREFVDNLIYFLKRKGNYSTIYVIYKFLLTNTSNTLNIYERWHEWNLVYDRIHPVELDYEDHHILESYGIQPSGAAGNDYYTRYAPSAYPVYADEPPNISASDYPILSPHYRVEIDLTSEPLGDDYIISEDIINELVRYWDYTKPVSRYVHYSELMAPDAVIDGESAEEISTYSEDYKAYLTTKFVGAQYTSTEQSSAGFGNDTYNHYNETSSPIWTIQDFEYS